MSFKEVFGHQREIRILQGMLKRDRLASSFLFTGPEGIGKRLIAKNLIKAINCQNPVEQDCCDTCPSCKKIDGNNHIDVFTVEEIEQDIKIETVRDIESFVATKPLEARLKCVIVDKAHNMNFNAQNALLKTLEEPPSGSIIILITSSPDLLLDTIKSRCFQIKFMPLSMSQSEVFAKKNNITQPSNLYIGLPGSMVSNESKNSLEYFQSILNDMSNGKVKETWKDINEMKQYLEHLIVFLRDKAVEGLSLEHPQMMLKAIDSKITSREDALRLYEEILPIYQNVDMNLNKKIVWNYVRVMLFGD